MVIIPGFRDLIGDPTITYEELVKDLPSSVIIELAIVLNNELYAPFTDEINQDRIRKIVSFRFSQEDITALNQVFSNFKRKTGGKYTDTVFATRYLLEMILKELNRNVQFELQDTTPQQELNFLLAYLMVIDEVNGRDQVVLQNAVEGPKDGQYDYRIMWTPVINQFEIHEKNNPAYEVFKLTGFLLFSFRHYRQYLKKYLHANGFTKIGELLGSYNQLLQGIRSFNRNEPLGMLNYISPAPGVDRNHLTGMTINSEFGKKFRFRDLKVKPLYFKNPTGYLSIDQRLLIKKVYMGPMFELYYNTSLQADKSFGGYRDDIAKRYMEETIFTGILRTLSTSSRDVLIFDSGNANDPDSYIRRKKAVFLFEFKGYIFPDSQPEKPDFEAIKNYIDSRFINNDDKKPKGVTQLIRQIELILENSTMYDQAYLRDPRRGRITIYPIICFDDFNFTMPGINEYLQSVFLEKLPKSIPVSVTIKPLTLINLELLFDLSSYGGDLEKLQHFIDRYWHIIQGRKTKFKKQPTADGRFAFRSSFTEIFYSIMVEELTESALRNRLDQLLAQAGLLTPELDEQV